MEIAPVKQQPRRFYDGGLPARDGRPAVPPDPGSDPRIVLERLTEEGLETFTLERRIAYDDREYHEILVPAVIERFHTDLTSVPAAFTWLVPKTGAHLPAALLHDGLVFKPSEGKTYVSTEGFDIKRAEADRVFRDAMADTGTGVVRRWLVWSAVTTWTMLEGTGTGWPNALARYYRVVAAATILVILYLGYCATLDLFDESGPLAVQLPWMGDRVWWLEIVGGLAGAIVVPLVLGLFWGRFRVAGVVAGIVLAVLLHVTVGVILITVGYQLLERLARTAPVVAAGLGVVAAVVSVLVVGFMVAGLF
jgi:hypothetical protein